MVAVAAGHQPDAGLCQCGYRPRRGAPPLLVHLYRGVGAHRRRGHLVQQRRRNLFLVQAHLGQQAEQMREQAAPCPGEGSGYRRDQALDHFRGGELAVGKRGAHHGRVDRPIASRELVIGDQHQVDAVGAVEIRRDVKAAGRV
jgi:hypothetical protein